MKPLKPCDRVECKWFGIDDHGGCLKDPETENESEFSKYTCFETDS